MPKKQCRRNCCKQTTEPEMSLCKIQKQKQLCRTKIIQNLKKTAVLEIFSLRYNQPKQNQYQIYFKTSLRQQPARNFFYVYQLHIIIVQCNKYNRNKSRQFSKNLSIFTVFFLYDILHLSFIYHIAPIYLTSASNTSIGIINE